MEEEQDHWTPDHGSWCEYLLSRNILSTDHYTCVDRLRTLAEEIRRSA